MLLEASRPQHLARRFPLRPGDVAWVGIRRAHALGHPGLGVLIVSDGSPASAAALEFGSNMAKRAHARVSILAHRMEEEQAWEHLRASREGIGTGGAQVETRLAYDDLAGSLETEARLRSIDVAICAAPPPDRRDEIEMLLSVPEVNALFVPGPSPLPRHALICVAIGEPAKKDVLFAGRLLRHLGADATIMTVLPDDAARNEQPMAERFLEAGRRALGVLGVVGQTKIRRGGILEGIEAETREGSYVKNSGRLSTGLLSTAAVVDGPLARHKGSWLRRAAYRTGRVWGSIKYRVFYL
jgi:hypothetical protein